MFSICVVWISNVFIYFIVFFNFFISKIKWKIRVKNRVKNMVRARIRIRVFRVAIRSPSCLEPFPSPNYGLENDRDTFYLG